MRFLEKHVRLLLISAWLFAMGSGVAAYMVYKSNLAQAHTGFRFGEMVRLQKKGFNFCNGMIRNSLAFGYYEIDGIECVMLADRAGNLVELEKATKVEGDRQEPMIISESDLRQVFERDEDRDHYCVIIGNNPFGKNLFYNNEKGQWISNVPHVHS